ncbi:SANT/Myb_domain [Hexamita inflata]|uniref:SANT/Myb domain n=1 Tax=Hexamita inflata TaxID=28002 RepID=A0AA86PPI5_9EUKA|nr:SANT/Myb domain [Hexamita inflata]
MPYWTEQENEQFFDLLKAYGKDFQQIAEYMNKSYIQVKSHYYNIQAKKSKDKHKESIIQANTQFSFCFIVFDYIK